MIREYMDKWVMLTNWERQDSVRDFVILATFTVVLFLLLVLVLAYAYLHNFQII